MMTEQEILTQTVQAILHADELDDFAEEIAELFRMCSSSDCVSIVVHLLRHLHLVTLDQIPSKLEGMAKVATQLLEDGRNLAIVAMAYDGSADGSQTIIQLLKPKLARARNLKIFNTVPNYIKKGGIDNYPRFILVDDFTGSGQTVLNRLKYISNKAAERKILIEPYVCLLYGMEKSIQLIQDSGYKVNVFNVLKAGISGYFSGRNLDISLDAVKKLEALLAPEIDGKKIPSLGYNHAEATFWIKDTNAPNSNFPIFWWPKYYDGLDRKTIMVRAEL